jgi:multiple antibiotic resistance protein
MTRSPDGPITRLKLTMNPQLAIQHLLHDLPSAATATFLALFPIVNPLGGVPLFFSLTADYSPEERRHTALKVALNVIAILVVFMLFGRFVLNFFGISLPVLKIAGGLIVANTAWGMVTGSSRMTMEEHSEALTKEDISLTPMAMPMLSGPGSIGVVMGLAADAEHFLSYVGMLIGIVAIGLTCYLCLFLGGPFVKRLGPGAMGAINRIFGFLILAIAVQLVWNGAADFRG